MAATSLRSLVAVVAMASATALLLAGCSASQGNSEARADGVIHVPSEAPTLTEAEAIAEPGDIIVVAPGTYDEQLLITTPDITIRGEDRNETIVDGDGVRPFGIVAMADGVRVENLTVANATFYGLLFTGLHDETGPQAPTANAYEAWDPEAFPPLQRFLADHVTAVNNGLYGIYAFNAQHGEIRDSYASGSADSGFYVGQCVECDILLTGNVAERNAVGYENSNASDSVIIAGNRFTGNRMGVTQLTSYQEAFSPQRGSTLVGNLIADNVAEATPAHANGGFGTGVGISGAIENVLLRNAIIGHPRAGVLLTNAEDLPADNNLFVDTWFEGNGLDGIGLDIVNISADRASASGNCVSGADDTAPPPFTTLPAELAAPLTGPDCGADAQPAADTFAGPDAPRGISYRDVAWPVPQPNLPERSSYDRLPDRVAMPSFDEFQVPSLDFLSERAGTR